jgi:uncharacterized cupin superfamily protein
MIIRNTDLKTESRTSDGWGTVETQRVGDAGGITQFGASVQTLLPGARSSLRHWHEDTDEMLFVLSGEVTVTEDTADYVLRPGDAACWPKGVAVAHTVSNCSSDACSYVVVGTRSSKDVCHYEEIGQIMRSDGERWTLVDGTGRVLREGLVTDDPWARM